MESIDIQIADFRYTPVIDQVGAVIAELFEETTAISFQEGKVIFTIIDIFF